MSWQKVYYYLFTAAYLAWNIHFISGLRSEARLFTVVIATLFLVLYLLPPTIFGAKIELVEQGVRVVQYGTAFIPYSEVRSCKSFFLFPVQAVVVTTKRRFPLNILISGDSLKGRRRSLIQDGELAQAIKSKIGVPK